jgi:hypothetical protein
MNNLSDDSLKDLYKKAMELDLDKEFIAILLDELNRREIDPKKLNVQC